MVKWESTLEFSLSSSLLILLLVGFSCPEASGRRCDLQYLKAPPSKLMCNPYSISARLMLECQVQVPASVGSKVEIQWFFNDTQTTLHIDSTSFPPPGETLQIENQTITDGDVWTFISSIIISGLTSPTRQGMYFCQVTLDGSITSLSPSDSVLLEDEESSGYLNFHPCSKLLFKETMRCAGNISSGNISSSSSPTSSSSSPTSSSSSPTSSSSSPTSSSSSPTSSSSTSAAVPPKSTTAGSPTAYPSGGNPALILWVYVLVAIAAVFALIIVALSILTVVFCLKMMETSKCTPNNSTNMTPVRNEISALEDGKINSEAK